MGKLFLIQNFVYLKEKGKKEVNGFLSKGEHFLTMGMFTSPWKNLDIPMI